MCYNLDKVERMSDHLHLLMQMTSPAHSQRMGWINSTVQNLCVRTKSVRNYRLYERVIFEPMHWREQTVTTIRVPMIPEGRAGVFYPVGIKKAGGSRAPAELVETSRLILRVGGIIHHKVRQSVRIDEGGVKCD
jgi:hypothetical protein